MAPDSKEKERLAKLIRLLSSDQDGEVLGAVRAIERTLKAAGKSFHDLADTIVDKVIVFEIKTPAAEGAPPHYATNYIEACKWLQERPLLQKEKEFIIDMKNRFKFNPDFNPTEKQANWFAAIVRKYSATVAPGGPNDLPF